MTPKQLRLELIQTQTKRIYGEPERLVKVNNNLFEKCIEDMGDNEKRTAIMRGFFRINTDSYFEEIDGVKMYHHGIINFFNTEADVNKIHTITTNKSEICCLLSKLNDKRERVINIDLQNNKIIVKYTQQRYIFEGVDL